MDVIGYEVRLWVAAGEWEPTEDQVFLGVYSARNGGREFALNTERSLSESSGEVVLVVGEQCCETTSGLTVHNSLNWGWNGPRNHPIDLDEIEHVYIRKHEGRNAASDDYLVLNSAEVVACDGVSMKRWESTNWSGPLPFHRDVGVQHWLTETQPPACIVTTTLRNIDHDVHGNFSAPASKNWKFRWDVKVNGQPNIWPNPLRNSTTYKHKGSGDAWTHWSQRSYAQHVPGCCPSGIEVEIYAFATALDRTFGGSFGGLFGNGPLDANKDDLKSKIEEVEVNCVDASQDPPKTLVPVKFRVTDPNRKKEASDLTWNFTVSAICT